MPALSVIDKVQSYPLHFPCGVKCFPLIARSSSFLIVIVTTPSKYKLLILYIHTQKKPASKQKNTHSQKKPKPVLKLKQSKLYILL